MPGWVWFLLGAVVGGTAATAGFLLGSVVYYARGKG